MKFTEALAWRLIQLQHRDIGLQSEEANCLSCVHFLLLFLPNVQSDSYGTGTFLLVVLGKGGSKRVAQPTNGGLLCVLAFCLLFWKLPIFCNSGKISFAFQS